MRITVDRHSDVSKSYRSERARGLFNVSEVDGSSFHLEADLPIESDDWAVGVVVGSSGSGKSSIGAELKAIGWEFAEDYTKAFHKSKLPIIDSIDDSASFDQITGVLSSVGLGSVPAWLRPYSVLSTGERFRADCAWMLMWPEMRRVVVDEFTSVLDRTVATLGAAAFVKAWRKQKGRQIVLLTCHHDVLDWVLPDWVFDTDKRALFAPPNMEVFLSAQAAEYPEVGRLVIKK